MLLTFKHLRLHSVTMRLQVTQVVRSPNDLARQYEKLFSLPGELTKGDIILADAIFIDNALGLR